MNELDEVQQLPDEALIDRLSLSVRSDRRLAVRLLVEMGEVQARGLYRELGFSSLFDFATRTLGMSESDQGCAFARALELLVAEEKKRRFAVTNRPRTSSTKRPTQHYVIADTRPTALHAVTRSPPVTGNPT